MAQFLGSANGTDFGPDLRTRTVHIHFFLRASPFCKSCIFYVSVCISMRARARLHAGARATAQTPVPGRARLRAQLGAHPSRANIRNVSASSFAPPRHVRERTGRGRNWCDRNLFLVSPKLIFRKKLDPVFGVRN